MGILPWRDKGAGRGTGNTLSQPSSLLLCCIPGSRCAQLGTQLCSSSLGTEGLDPWPAERREKQTLSRRSRDWAKHQDRNWGAQEGRHSRQRGWAQLSRAICATHKATYCRYCPCLVIVLLITRETCIIHHLHGGRVYLTGL